MALRSVRFVGAHVLAVVLLAGLLGMSEPLEVGCDRHGFVVGGRLYGCGDDPTVADEGWDGPGLLSDRSYVTRLYDSGAWSISVPIDEWGRSATPESTIVVERDGVSFTLRGVRMLDVVGPSHFVVSDPDFVISLVSSTGERVPSPRWLEVSETGTVVAYDKERGDLSFFASAADLGREDADVRSARLQLAEGEEIVGVRWLGPRLLLFEINPPTAPNGLVLEQNRVVLVDRDDPGVVLRSFAERRIRGARERGGAVLVGPDRDSTFLRIGSDGEVVDAEIRLGWQESITGVSPDRRYMLVSRSPAVIGGWPVTTVRPVASPREKLFEIPGKGRVRARFSGWVRCDCD